MEFQLDSEYLQLVRNAAFPKGELGAKMIDGMNHEHAPLTQWGFELLKFGNRILDVGCGGGAALNKLALLYPTAQLIGCDISPLAVESAQTLNTDFVQSGRMKFYQAGVPSLPFEDNTFDTVFSVESLYFWSDPIQGLKEIFRVIAPNGMFMTVLEMVEGHMTPKYQAVAKELKMHCPDADTLYQEFQSAGFADIQTEFNPDKGWVRAVGSKNRFIQ